MNAFFGVIFGGGGGYLLCLLVTRIRQEEIRHDRGLIRRWMDDNDQWAIAQAELFAAEQSHVTGELIAVVDTPVLLDRPAEDEDEVGDEQPGEVPSRLLVPVLWVARVVGSVIELVLVGCERVRDAFADWRQSWRTRNEVGNGEVEADPFERFRIDDNPRGRSDAHPLTDEEIAAELAELIGEPVAVEIAEIREVDGRKQVRPAAHWNDGTAVHTTVYVGRRRKADA